MLAAVIRAAELVKSLPCSILPLPFPQAQILPGLGHGTAVRGGFPHHFPVCLPSRHLSFFH